MKKTSGCFFRTHCTSLYGFTQKCSAIQHKTSRRDKDLYEAYYLGSGSTALRQRDYVNPCMRRQDVVGT